MRTAFVAFGILLMIASPPALATSVVPQALVVNHVQGTGVTVLTWTPLPGALTYEVWKLSGDHFDLVEVTSQTAFVDTDAWAGSSYLVTAKSIFGAFGSTQTESGSQCVETQGHDVNVDANSCTTVHQNL